MRAVAVSVSATHATVVLAPCWLARLFGARTVTCNLVYENGWVHNVTRSRVSYSPHASKIIRALDYRPVAELPVARAIT